MKGLLVWAFCPPLAKYGSGFEEVVAGIVAGSIFFFCARLLALAIRFAYI